MKKSILVISLILTCFITGAQNVQLHYDFGSVLYDNLGERPKFTSTVENFKHDKWGNTFYFIDMDYRDGGISGAYWEIFRELSFWQAPVLLHVEYNGGLTNHFSFNNAWLGGLTYSYNSADFTKCFSLTGMYKYIQNNEKPHNFQVTAAWRLKFAKGLCDFVGFADFWREKTFVGDYIFLSEPQFWFNLNKLNGIPDDFNLSVGSEVELSYNFCGMEDFHAIPTLAIKWTF